MQFKLGDVVYLKSGGPAMTVAELTDDGYIAAWWFEPTDGPFEHFFEPEMLELAADEDGFYDADEFLTGHEDTEDLSDAELDAIIADYERDRAR